MAGRSQVREAQIDQAFLRMHYYQNKTKIITSRPDLRRKQAFQPEGKRREVDVSLGTKEFPRIA